MGLEKLEFAASQVAQMQKELEELQPQLKTAAVENDKMMIIIDKVGWMRRDSNVRGVRDFPLSQGRLFGVFILFHTSWT